MQFVLRELREATVVPVAVIDDASNALPLVDALTAGGINTIELTLRTDAAGEAIEMIAKERPRFLLGVGTVLDTDQLRFCMDAGAKYALAPGFDAAVVSSAQDAGFPFFPGVMTPSEAQQAMALGVRTVKLFPAEAADGLKMITALDGAFGHLGLQYIPLGGLDPTRSTFYLREPSVLAVGGSWVAPRKSIAAGDWATIERNARDAATLRGLRA